MCLVVLAGSHLCCFLTSFPAACSYSGGSCTTYSSVLSGPSRPREALLVLAGSLAVCMDNSRAVCAVRSCSRAIVEPSSSCWRTGSQAQRPERCLCCAGHRGAALAFGAVPRLGHLTQPVAGQPAGAQACGRHLGCAPRAQPRLAPAWARLAHRRALPQRCCRSCVETQQCWRAIGLTAGGHARRLPAGRDSGGVAAGGTRQ